MTMMLYNWTIRVLILADFHLPEIRVLHSTPEDG